VSLAFLRKTAFALVFAFIASVGMWSFNSAHLAHEMQHEMAQVASATGGSVDFAQPADQDHELLHAVAQIQPCPLASFEWPTLSAVRALDALFTTPAVTHATREPPFRPPRSISLVG
jgi:hypothetical protein